MVQSSTPRPDTPPMTDDLVGRLRAFCEHHGFGDGSSPALAAARIEALEDLVRRAQRNVPDCYVNWHATAQAALNKTRVAQHLKQENAK